MRRFLTKIGKPFLNGFAKFYFAKTRPYRYKDIKVVVFPGIFFPQFTLSTKLLLQFLTSKNLTDKCFLELGCGTGIISVLAAKKGAKVIATDINPEAIENAQLNAKSNGVSVTTILSDLFKDIPKQPFDYIIINPPYYPKDPKSIAEKAWFCGIDFEYFENLFADISPYFNANSDVIMILSQDCEIDKIKEIAKKNKLALIVVLEQKKWGEMNFIFRLKSI